MLKILIVGVYILGITSGVVIFDIYLRTTGIRDRVIKTSKKRGRRRA